METNHLKVGTYLSSFASKQKTAKAFLFSFSFVFSYFYGNSQTTPLSLTQISTSSPDLISPGRGAEYWNGVAWDGSSAPTVPSGNTSTLNSYYRFSWTDFENSSQGVYNWTKFDNQINNAIDNGRSFSFGIMSMCSGCGYPGGLGYPTYLHNQMQAEANKDWLNSDGAWVPNWNSNNYLTSWESLLNALASHINSGSRNGKNYKDAIYYVDIRGYGDYGEWHNCCYLQQSPTGTRATSASLKRIIDAHKSAFPNYPLVALIAAFDTGNPTSTAQPADLAYYALTTSNNWGRIGWRRDNWGDAGYDNNLKNNTGSYNPGSGSVSFSSLIMNTYKVAPVVGEPSTDASAISRNCGTPQCDLVNEIKNYHATSFGNGNYPNASDGNLQANVRTAAAVSGYRLVVTGGSMNSTLTPGLPFNMSLSWQNIGIAPTYDNWNVVFELRSSSGVVWSSNSSFKPKLFLPSSTPSVVSENFTLPSTVAAGTYSLYLIVKDPANYKKPLPLAITGRNADGSYLLRSNITVGLAGNLPPTASAGPDQTIQAPATTVSLTGTASDADGSVSTLAWTIVSGPVGSAISSPSTASTNITGLIQGVYVYRFSATDNQGATSTDDIQITVSAAAPPNQAPIANAGADITITQPVNSTNLNGSSSVDPDGSTLTYSWTKISGPSQFSLANSSAASTVLNNLVPGTYSFRLRVTDNGGATASDTVLVTVNAAPPANQNPIANAGADITVTLPSNIANLNGSGSVDPDGSIASYAWTKTSGPAQYAITNAALANTGISNLVQGTYTFQLTVTDNAGATATDLVNVKVNAAPAPPANQAPEANVGGSISLTLPVNTATLNGSASSDPDGTITSFAWSKISGPGQFTIGNPSLASTQVSNLAQGVYAFQLQVTDNGGSTASDTVLVTVNAAPPANQTPVANAGANITITLPTNTTNLNGSGSIDPDGSITSYAWTKTSGPAQYAITNPALANTGISNLVQGTYTFKLTVTDNAGATATDLVNVRVNVAAAPPANQAPDANVGGNISLTLPVNTAALNGSASSDPDGTITSYAWSKISGPGQFTIGNPSLASTLVSNLAQGVYAFQLQVNDNGGLSGNDTLYVTVNAAAPAPANQTPVANAGANITITLPTNTTNLNGSGSIDPDGSITSYAWTKTSGPSQYAITNPALANTGISNLVQGTYTFKLTVTDNAGATATDLVNVKVNAAAAPPANQAPIANVGGNINLTLPANSATLNGSASSDPDGTISSYTWSKISGSGQFTIANPAQGITQVSNLTQGSYAFRLQVTDNGGLSGYDTLYITVNAAPAPTNQLPVANAGSAITITLPTNSVGLDGTTSWDPDGSIASYSWAKISGPGSSTIVNATSATPSITGLVFGQYAFELTVTDNGGGKSKDQVTVTVLNSPNAPPVPAAPVVNQAPVAVAGENMTIPLTQTSVTLNGANSYDPDGSITAYTWKQVSGPSLAKILSPSGAVTQVSTLVEGSYVFELDVSDNSNASASTAIKVDVVNTLRFTLSLKIYPNPVSSLLTFQYLSDLTGKVAVSIYSASGAIMFSAEYNKDQSLLSKQIDVSKLPKGLYYIKIIQPDGTKVSKSFWKK